MFLIAPAPESSDPEQVPTQDGWHLTMRVLSNTFKSLRTDLAQPVSSACHECVPVLGVRLQYKYFTQFGTL